MQISFNINEIFEIAEQIERNGAKFYRSAAEFSDDASTSSKLLQLAEMEDEHERIFKNMRAELVTDTRDLPLNDPDNLATMVLQAWANKAVFDMEKDPMGVLTAGTSLNEVLEASIGREKESIVYYEGLKTGLNVEEDREKINAIIREEMTHIAILSRQLMELYG